MTGTTVREIQASAVKILRQHLSEGAERDARILIADALQTRSDRLFLHLDDRVNDATAARIFDLVSRRAKGCPVSRLIGRRLFWGRVFAVTGDVLDPRPETEILIERALSEPFSKLLDLGTGTGIIAVTLLAERGEATGMAVDISPEAVAIAQRNATTHEVESRLFCSESNWFSAVADSFDLIVSNPPYIAEAEMADLAPEVRDHDPRIALTDGADGLTAYRAIAGGAMDHLTPGGRLLVEIGPTQGAAVSRLFRDAGLEGVRVHPDLDGRDRVVEGRKS